LTAALRRRGHDALAWSPEPLTPRPRWWNLHRRRTRAIEAFVATNGPFDVIDTQAITATSVLSRSARLVVRSVQPELRYLHTGLRAEARRGPTPRLALHSLLSILEATRIVAGWRRADHVLCLGSIELERMRRSYPRWSAKLGMYVIAPPAADRSRFEAVRAARSDVARPATAGKRFLWLGRWTAHKGTRLLGELLGEREKRSSQDSFTLAGTGADPGIGSPRCRVIPSYRRDELPSLLQDHDAGLFTSEVEGWGLSLNEMLESGLPVFATEAGGVADLKAYFPESLRPFPPPLQFEPPRLEDLESNGYRARFDWDAIATSYEEQVLQPTPTMLAMPRRDIAADPRPQ
jgi:glycosyltransferase involved in cell wall biosynthesis